MKAKHSLLFSSLMLGSVGVAAQTQFNGGLATSLVTYNVDSALFSENRAESISIEPYLSANVINPRLRLSANIRQQFLERDLEDESGERDDFTNYNYRGSFDAFENVLSLNFRGFQRFLNLEQTDQFVNDLFLGSAELAETRSNNVGFVFNLPDPEYIGLTMSGNLGEVKTDQSLNRTQALDVTNQNLSARIYNGKAFGRFGWNINGTYADNDGRQRNVESREIGGEIFYSITNNLRFIITGNSERNQISNLENLTSSDLDYDSYGTGLTWYVSDDRNMSLTYNQSERLDDGNREEFVGANVRWSLSPRTSIRASYGRRFFGETGEFAMTYRLRHTQFTIKYNEDVTNFSRLQVTESDLGTFVCSTGPSGLSECFLPGDENYELGEGEFFEDIVVDIAEIQEQSILKKTLGWNIAYNKGKFRTALNLRRSNIDYLESTRKQTTEFGTWNSTYDIGVRTALNLVANYSRVTGNNEFTAESKTVRGTLGVSHQLNRSMTTNLNFRYLDRDSQNDDRDIVDRRITLEFDYSF